ncbi:formate/nitrite transporter family protein [Candidatus Electronema sp. JC]|uniref:formate/nitrite transporter family protein n=1 Tax=Candidatus Electronema sp. JC TaxID=3401570 RepID=UPI003B432E90
METAQNYGDAYSPDDIARKVESMGVRKANADTLTLLVLAMLAGAFIALGSLFFTVVVTDSRLGFGPTRLLGGLSFSLGLVLVVVGGAELFTGNNLLTMAWASGQIRASSVLRNWTLSYIGNVVGALATVVLVVLAGVADINDGAVGATAVQIAAAKSNLTLCEAFLRGMFCNALVCLAVWLAMGGRSVMDKIMAIFLPVSAFVAIGFEHSIANWFFLPYGLILDNNSLVSCFGSVTNIIMSTAGNIIGGAVQVGAIYWVAYLRKTRRPA